MRTPRLRLQISLRRTSPLSLLLLAGLLGPRVSLADDSAAPAPEAKAPQQATHIRPGDDRPSIKGKVLEKIDASSYTYLRLSTADLGEVWVAVPQTKIKKGAKVTLNRPIPMFGFESKTLKRKFDKMYFGVLTSQRAEVAAQTKGHWLPGMGAQEPSPSVPPGHPSVGKAPAPDVDLANIKVKKAEGAGAVTIAELFQNKSSLKAKTVTVRGQVFKYNAGIMGKNWVHIADGSGTTTAKNFDLTVVTTDNANIGDTVLVSGVVAIDKSVGPYFFPVALDDASLKVEK